MDKLKLSKILLLFLVLPALSCKVFSKDPETNTEVICPNGSAILIKFIQAKELREAINAAYLTKKKLKTSENYTTIRLKDGRSFALKGIPPEVASTCDLRQSKIGEVEASYIHHF